MICPISSEGNAKGKDEVDNDCSEGEKEIQTRMLDLFVFEFEKRDDAFQHPEEHETTSNNEGPGKRRNRIEKFLYSTHRKGDRFL